MYINKIKKDLFCLKKSIKINYLNEFSGSLMTSWLFGNLLNKNNEALNSIRDHYHQRTIERWVTNACF